MKIIKRSIISTGLILLAVFIITTAGSIDGRASLLEQYYNEAISENAELKTFIKDWEKVRESANEKKRQLLDKIGDIETYYREARHVALGISDAAVKEKADKMVNDGEAAAKKLIDPLRQQLAELAKQEQRMRDYEALLKIKYTLPKVKALEGQLNANEIKAAIKEYEALVAKAGKMVENP